MAVQLASKGAVYYTATADELNAANTTRENDTEVMKLLKSIQITENIMPSLLRIKFTLQSLGAYDVYAQIYKNNLAIGTLQTENNGSSEFSEDIAGWKLHDYIQLYAKTAVATSTAKVSLFKICGAKKLAKIETD